MSDSGKTTEAEVETAGGATLVSLTVEEGPQVKGCRQPLEARKNKEIDSPLAPLQGQLHC